MRGKHLSQQGTSESMTGEHHLLYHKIDFLDDKTSEIGWHTHTCSAFYYSSKESWSHSSKSTFSFKHLHSKLPWP